jgi:enoyl-CoA hydratase
LVTRVVPDDALHDEAVALASQIAAYTSIGLRMTKEVMWANLDAPNMSAAIALENRNQTIAGRNPEVQAYMDAYMAPRRGAKRPRGGYPASQ